MKIVVVINIILNIFVLELIYKVYRSIQDCKGKKKKLCIIIIKMKFKELIHQKFHVNLMAIIFQKEKLKYTSLFNAMWLNEFENLLEHNIEKKKCCFLLVLLSYESWCWRATYWWWFLYFWGIIKLEEKRKTSYPCGRSKQYSW